MSSPFRGFKIGVPHPPAHPCLARPAVAASSPCCRCCPLLHRCLLLTCLPLSLQGCHCLQASRPQLLPPLPQLRLQQRPQQAPPARRHPRPSVRGAAAQGRGTPPGASSGPGGRREHCCRCRCCQPLRLRRTASRTAAALLDTHLQSRQASERGQSRSGICLHDRSTAPPMLPSVETRNAKQNPG